jgi:hypothetical protein
MATGCPCIAKEISPRIAPSAEPGAAGIWQRFRIHISSTARKRVAATSTVNRYRNLSCGIDICATSMGDLRDAGLSSLSIGEYTAIVPRQFR